jgi:hypothetical protein
MTRQNDVEAVGKPTRNGLSSTELRSSAFTHNALIFTAAALGSTSEDGPARYMWGLVFSNCADMWASAITNPLDMAIDFVRPPKIIYSVIA